MAQEDLENQLKQQGDTRFSFQVILIVINLCKYADTDWIAFFIGSYGCMGSSSEKYDTQFSFVHLNWLIRGNPLIYLVFMKKM